MKLTLLLLAACLHAQVNPLQPGDNGAVSLGKINGNFSYLNTAKPARFVGSGAPGSVAGNLPGDIYSDTSGNNAYLCGATAGTSAPACTSVTAGGWLLLNGGGTSFNPYSATSGNAAASAVWAPTGNTQTFVEPGQVTLGGSSPGNLQASQAIDVYAGGLYNPAGYGNIAGQFYRTTLINGMNSNDNANKDTLFGNEYNTIFAASGQRYGMAIGAYSMGGGDIFALNLGTFYSNRSTAFGDEGIKILDAYLQQNWTVQTQILDHCNAHLMRSDLHFGQRGFIQQSHRYPNHTGQWHADRLPQR